MSDSNNTQATGDQVAAAVEAQVAPQVSTVADMLRLAIKNVPEGKRKNVASDAEVELAINALLDWSRSVKPGKLPAQHEATCHSLVANQPKDELGNVVDVELRVKEALDKIRALGLPEADTAGLLTLRESQVRGEYTCDCAVSKARRSSGNRAAPSSSGPVKATVRRIEVDANGKPVTGEVLETFEAPSMSEAAKKVAAWYPNATQSQKYAPKLAAGQSLNARKFIDSDLDAGRIPAEAVSYSDQGTTAEAAAAETKEEAPAS